MRTGTPKICLACIAATEITEPTENGTSGRLQPGLKTRCVFLRILRGSLNSVISVLSVAVTFSRLALLTALLACNGFLGCATIDSTTRAEVVKPDPLCEQISKQKTIEVGSGWCKVDPAVVLKEIPLGTPLPQARSIMEGHGFHCLDGTGDSQGIFLKCTANNGSRWVVAVGTVVKIYHQAGRVTDIQIVRRVEKP